MTKWAILAGLLALPASAAETPAPAKPPGTPACFDLSQTHDFVASGEILLNHCTGDTWLLVKTSADMEGGFVYRWRPILVDQGEAVLSDPASRAAAMALKKNPASQ